MRTIITRPLTQGETYSVICDLLGKQSKHLTLSERLGLAQSVVHFASSLEDDLRMDDGGPDHFDDQAEGNDL